METARRNIKKVKKSDAAWQLPVLKIGIAAILLIAPFYTPISVWLASRFGHFDFWRIWKEIILAGLAVILFSFLTTRRRLIHKIVNDRLFLLLILYSLLIIWTSIYDLITGHVRQPAVIYGFLVDLRFICFMAVVLLAVGIRQAKISIPWQKIVLIPAAIVVLFGLLQFTILPKNVLSHVGYSQTTIVPYQTVDKQPDFARVQSTLRGPNPLGAYLLLITILTLSQVMVNKGRTRLLYGGFTLLTVVVLFGTYSRSAWAGLVLSGLVLLVLSQRQRFSRKVLLAFGVIILLVITSLTFFRDNYVFQNVFFHSSDRSASAQSSNTQRSSALEQGLEDIWHDPLGSGVGSAGPASLRNDPPAGGPRIAENYFLQIGQEVGVLGIALFIAISVILAARLYQQRADPLAAALLASLVGLTFVSLLSHAWTDDTLAYIWWGLAALVIARNKPATQN